VTFTELYIALCNCPAGAELGTRSLCFNRRHTIKEYQKDAQSITTEKVPTIRAPRWTLPIMAACEESLPHREPQPWL